MTPAHIGVRLTFSRLVTEVAPAIDHLLGRASADAKLQTAAGDEIGRAGVLSHVKRVFVAHVDDSRADLDALGLGAYGRKKRERCGKLPREMMDAEIGTVGTQFLGRNSKFHGLQ